jgi:hypothetical protein
MQRLSRWRVRLAQAAAKGKVTRDLGVGDAYNFLRLAQYSSEAELSAIADQLRLDLRPFQLHIRSKGTV